MIPQTWSRSVVGLVFGFIALMLVTAVLTAAVYSFGAAGQAKDAVRELRDNAETSDARSLRAQQDRAALKDQNDKLLGQNRAVLQQNEALRHQLAALVIYLREHGLETPAAVIVAPVERHPRPKRPRPKASKPNPPPPFKPQPKDPFCEFSPLFCPLNLPKVVLP